MTYKKQLESIKLRIGELHLKIQAIKWPTQKDFDTPPGPILRYIKEQRYKSNSDKIHKIAILFSLFEKYKLKKMKAFRHSDLVSINGNNLRRINFIVYAHIYISLDIEIDDYKKYVDVSYTWFKKSPRLKFKKNILDIIEEELAEIEQSLA